MHSDTSHPPRVVKTKSYLDSPPVNWKHHHAAKRALDESPLIPYEVSGMFHSLLSWQGSNTHAFPTLKQLAAKAGSKGKALRIIDKMVALIPEVIQIERQAKGRRRNSYRCLRFEDWPIDLIKRLSGTGSKIEPLRAVVAPKQNHYMVLLKDDTLLRSNKREDAPVKTKDGNDWRPEPINTSHNPPWRCDHCGKPELGRRSEVRGSHVFCNNGCYGDWYNKHHPHGKRAA